MDKEFLLNVDYDKYEKVFELLKNEQKDTKYFKDISMKTEVGNINVFAIRCNDIGIANDQIRNNDFLVVLHYTDTQCVKLCLSVTTDPKTHREYIANIYDPQLYFGNIRNHHWTPGRLCIAQDNCKVWVRRYYDKDPSHYIDREGNFTINIHDNGGFYNSSLGCVILADETDYHEEFYPLLKNCTNKDYVPVMIIRDNKFEELYNKIS
jgi:hypothetical protein